MAIIETQCDDCGYILKPYASAPCPKCGSDNVHKHLIDEPEPNDEDLGRWREY